MKRVKVIVGFVSGLFFTFPTPPLHYYPIKLEFGPKQTFLSPSVEVSIIIFWLCSTLFIFDLKPKDLEWSRFARISWDHFIKIRIQAIQGSQIQIRFQDTMFNTHTARYPSCPCIYTGTERRHRLYILVQILEAVHMYSSLGKICIHCILCYAFPCPGNELTYLRVK